MLLIEVALAQARLADANEMIARYDQQIRTAACAIASSSCNASSIAGSGTVSHEDNCVV